MSVSANKKLRIFRRDNFRCKCGSTKELTIDHVIPLSKGGTDDDSNLVTMCFPCNLKKGNTVKTPTLLKKLFPSLFFADDAFELKQEMAEMIKAMKTNAVNESSQVFEKNKPAIREYISEINKVLKNEVLSQGTLITDTRASISKSVIESVTRDNQTMAILRLTYERLEALENYLGIEMGEEVYQVK